MEHFVSPDHSLIWQRMRILNPDVASMTMFDVTNKVYTSLDGHLNPMQLQTSWYGLGFGVGEPPSHLQIGGFDADIR